MFLSLANRCWWLQVSMVDGSLFDSLEAIARSIRGSKAPFGGIQLVLAGSSQTGCTHTRAMYAVVVASLTAAGQHFRVVATQL